MDTTSNTKNTQSKDFWEEIRDTVLDGIRELRNQGDEFSRRSRLRIDIVQTQRRLSHAFETLGEMAHEKICGGVSVTMDDPVCRELCSRVDYYRNELVRLRAEFQRTAM